MIARALAVLSLISAGCSELPEIAAAQCGNGIVERFEDCDNPSSLCVQCHLVCTDPEPGSLVGNCSSGNTGYTCGFDDRCYAPGAEFGDSSVSVPFPVIGFRVLDLDGDRFGDVVGLNQSLLSVRYGDARADLLDSYSVVTPPAQGHPALTHLDDDGVDDDLIIPVIDGLVAFTGAFGVPSPRQFPLGSGASAAAGRPDPIDAVQVDTTVGLVGPHSNSDPSTSVGVLSLAFGTPTFDAETQTLCGQTFNASTYITDSAASYRSPGPNGSTFLAMHPTVGITCVMMFTRSPQARGTGSCPIVPEAPGLPGCTYSITSVGQLPAFATAPVLADLDGDGCPSLLDASAGVNALVEYRGSMGGAGCQLATTGTPLPALGQPSGARLLHALPLEPVITGVARDALITSYGIVGITTGATPGPRALYVSDREVTRSLVGDVTNDGRTDAILTTNVSNIDVVRRVPGADSFLLYRLPTTGPVDQMRIGDFDGDGRSDLAYAERLGQQDQLAIAYGTDSGLAEAVAVDAFTRVEYLAIMEVRDSTDPFNVVDDLIAIDHDPAKTSREFTLLHGSPNRTMLSFYGPPVPEQNTAYLGVIGGHFVETDASAGKMDLVAFQIQRGGPTRVQVIPGFGDGRLGQPQRVNNAVPTSPALTVCNGATPPPGVFCLDGAKFTWWPLGDHDIVVGIDSQGSAAGLFFDPAAPDTVVVGSGMFPHGGKIRTFDTFDVDHDGDFEVVATFEASGGIAGYTLVCSPTAQGRLDPTACVDVATLLGDSSLECTAAAVGRITPPCVDPSIGRKDLVVACHGRGPAGEHSEVHEIEGDATGLHAGRLLLAADGKRYIDVQLGDVNGDSIHDLVVLDDASGIPQLEVHPQLPASVSNVCFPDD